MDFLIYLIYPALLLLLLSGVRRLPAEELCSDKLPGKEKTKPLLGFFAICILLHHLSQKTSASWLPDAVRKPGLEPFVNTGFLFVSYFFFVSGFGLWKSSREKEDYLDSFPEKRIYPLVLTFVFSEFIYILAGLLWPRASLPLNGYSWFVFTILLLYILFSVIMRICPKAFIPLMSLSVALYCAVCFSLVAGEWWYNSVPAFPAGLLAGKYEKKLADALRKTSVTIPLLILTALSATAANHTEIISLLYGPESCIAAVKITQLFLQMAAAVLFPLLMTAFLLRVKVGNRALDYLGSLTLEIYLTQGLFVDLFSYCFIKENDPPVFYIRNAALYCLAVIALTLPVAWLLQKVCDYSKDGLRRSGFARMLWKDAKALVRVLAGIAVCVTLFMSVRTRITARNMEEKIDDFRRSNIECIPAGDATVAVSVTGEGENTVVLLGDESAPCPSLIYEELAGMLSASCTVMTVDRPGSGFSGDTASARTSENIARELHETLHQTDSDIPVVLVANGSSGLYALEYAGLYPEDVKAFIGIDAYVPSLGDYEQSLSGYAPDEYAWRAERLATRDVRVKRIAHLFGFDRWGLSVLDMLNHGGHAASNRDILNELYLAGQVSRATGNEHIEYYENTRRLAGKTFPSGLPCRFLIHYSLTDHTGNGPDLQAMTDSVISDNAAQKTVIIAGNPYGIVTDPTPLAEQILLFLDETE